MIAAPGQVLTYADNTSVADRQRDSCDTMTMVYPEEDYVINRDMPAGVQQGPY